jgi:hypothetical protein
MEASYKMTGGLGGPARSTQFLVFLKKQDILSIIS